MTPGSNSAAVNADNVPYAHQQSAIPLVDAKMTGSTNMKLSADDTLSFAGTRMKTAITNVRVFDGYKVTPPSTVVIDGDRIGVDSTGAYVVDGLGGVLLPGLFDAHVHLNSLSDFEAMRNWGVTTALDIACFPTTLLDLMREKAGRNGLSDCRSTGYPANFKQKSRPLEGWVTDPSQADEFVADRISKGSDYIKIVHDLLMSQDIVTALVAAAHQNEKLAIVHAVLTMSFEIAQKAGADFITHAPLDKTLDRAFIDRMVSEGQVCIPTLIMMEKIPSRGTMTTEASSDARALQYANATKSLKAMCDAGVAILAGTDANRTPFAPAHPMHGQDLHHDEMELLVDAGLKNVDALRAATILPALHFGLSDRGIIEPGNRAHLVLVAGNPLEEITATKNIQQVWINGVNWVS